MRAVERLGAGRDVGRSTHRSKKFRGKKLEDHLPVRILGRMLELMVDVGELAEGLLLGFLDRSRPRRFQARASIIFCSCLREFMLRL